MPGHRLVRRLRARTGIEFAPHHFRHGYATDLLRCGVAREIVQKLLGHASISTTPDTYCHVDVEDDALRALVSARTHRRRVGGNTPVTPQPAVFDPAAFAGPDRTVRGRIPGPMPEDGWVVDQLTRPSIQTGFIAAVRR